MFQVGARAIGVGAISRASARPHIQIRWKAQMRRRPARSNTVLIEDTFDTRELESPAKGLRKASKRKSRPQFTDSVLYTKKYIQKNFEVPIASQYNVSFNIVTEFPNLLEDSGLETRRGNGKLAHPLPGNSLNGVWSTLHIALDGERALEVKGHGSTTGEAQAAANLHAICQLHKLGNLQQFLAVHGRYMHLDPTKLRREADTKKDIINYAARHGCLPKFSFHGTHTRPNSKTHIKALQKGNSKHVYRAHASIPELGLDGYGRGGGVPNAILAASLSLKHAAEARHAATGEGTLLIKDYTNLTTDSGEKFVYFYCSHQRLECNTVFNETKPIETGGSWVMNVLLKSRESHQAQNDIVILKRNWRPLYDTNAWPGNLRGEADLQRTFEGISMMLKDDAEAVGFLLAAVALKKESPSLWDKFVKEMRRGNGDILKAVSPIDLALGSKTMEIVKNTLEETGAAMHENTLTINESDARTDQNLERSRQLSESEIQEKNELLRRKLDRYETHPSLTELRRLRLELPMSQSRDEVLKMVHQNDVCVVVGATGSGKTTQVPQLILDDLIQDGKGASCNILCTQPRRIAAVSVAQRVSVERNERLGESVGYSVRFNTKAPEFGGSIHYLTTGVLLKQIQQSQEETLEGISHIIVDEVHERDLNNDFLLVVLKNLMEDRKAAGKPAIKIILMSATIDTSLFCKYFGNGYSNKMCPFIQVPGRTFPVTSHFLDEISSELRSTYSRDLAMDLYSKNSDDYISRELEGGDRPTSLSRAQTEELEDDVSPDNVSMINWKSKGMIDDDGEVNIAINKEDTLTPVGLMGVTIAHILKTTTEGSILVFLPGLPEIVTLDKQLKTTRPLGIDFDNNPDYRVYVLHSSLPHMQQEVFAKAGPGQRKIILATNIAETSVTIPDVIYVVDSSKQREMQYDKARRISTLVSTWTAKSNAQQRAGRAGRVQHGHYYTMASKARYESFEVAPKPEILRTDLQTLCLQIKKMGVDNIWEFLSRAIQPPSRSAVETAIEELQALTALDDDENLTPLGRYLSSLPLAPSVGKMVVLAAIFRCLDPILILAAVSTSRSPFLSPLGNREEAERCRAKWAMGTGDDQAAIVHAFQEWRRIKRTGRGSRQPEKQFAWDNFLHHDTLSNIARIADQVMDILQSSGLVEPAMQSINGVTNQYGSEYENAYSDSHPLQVALVTAGFYPNIAIRMKEGLPRFLRTVHENEAAINPYSLAAPQTTDGRRYGRITYQSAAPPGTLFTFAEKTQGDDQGVFLRNVTRTFPLAVYLFGGKTSTQGSIITVDGWIPFYSHKSDNLSLQRLYNNLQTFLQRTFSRLGTAKPRRAAAQQFLDQDKVRVPLVEGVVHALESCVPKGSLALRSTKERPTFYEGSNEREEKSNLQDFYSSPRLERSGYLRRPEYILNNDRDIFDEGEYKPHEAGERPPGFYSDGRRGKEQARVNERTRGPSGLRSKAKAKSTLLDLLNRWQN
jgi:ATP-dependent RNA helicase DHX36